MKILHVQNVKGAVESLKTKEYRVYIAEALELKKPLPIGRGHEQLRKEIRH